MRRETVSTILLICLTAGALWATYCLLEPFLWPFLTSVVLAIAFHPLFTRLRRFFKTDSRAALATLLLALFALIVPLAVIAVTLTQELYGLVETIGKQSQTSGGFAVLTQSWLNHAAALAGRVVHIQPDDAKARLADALEKIRLAVQSSVAAQIGHIFTLAIQTVIVMVLVYFLLREGHTIMERLTRFQLLDRGRRERLCLSISETIQASMYGILTVAVVEAVLMTAALAVLGVPNALLWGTVTLFASLVPLAGTSLVWIPAALYLFATAGWMKALAIVLWGLVVMGGIDNLVGPLVMKGKVKLHPLILLFALLGGTQVFGLLGLFAGPVILSVTFALLDMVEFDLQKAGFLDESRWDSEPTEEALFSEADIDLSKTPKPRS
ncbi:MAG TPA: AI-2E family transporter [Bryobacteraceae bacterium]|nr:AI-2E family transporter [Bryobacteraceae bacterium]